MTLSLLCFGEFCVHLFVCFLIWSGRLGSGHIVLVERFISNIKKEVLLVGALMNEMWRRRDYDGS